MWMEKISQRFQRTVLGEQTTTQDCAWAINFDYQFFATLIRQQWANGDALVRDHLLYNPDIKKGLKVSKSAPYPSIKQLLWL